MSESHPDWRTHGVRVIKGDQLDPNTAQTPGMSRAAAINAARVGAQKLWAGAVTIHPNAKTGPHHHGALESVIYVVRGKARMRWGERLEFVAEAGPGDFIFVPPRPKRSSNACWCAATTSRSSSTSTSTLSRSPKPSIGSIRCTQHRTRSGPCQKGGGSSQDSEPLWQR